MEQSRKPYILIAKIRREQFLSYRSFACTLNQSPRSGVMLYLTNDPRSLSSQRRANGPAAEHPALICLHLTHFNFKPLICVYLK